MAFASDAGATALLISISAETLASLMVGSRLTLTHVDDVEIWEVITIAGFGGAGSVRTISLMSPTQFAYPAGSFLELVADVKDDPHVCALSGECYDIREPSMYALLRVPSGEQEPPVFELSADLDTDGVRPCGLYVKNITLGGSWLDDQVVRIRSHTRDVGGSNVAGSRALTNFSLQLGDSPWMSFVREDSGQQVAEVGHLAVRFVWREQYGQNLEAKSLEFTVGGGRNQSARLTISQASHQALNLEMWGMGRLGYSRIGGMLGTDGHLDSIERPTLACRAAAPSSNHDVPQRQQPGTPRELETASTLKVSWD